MASYSRTVDVYYVFLFNFYVNKRETTKIITISPMSRYMPMYLRASNGYTCFLDDKVRREVALVKCTKGVIIPDVSIISLTVAVLQCHTCMLPSGTIFVGKGWERRTN